MTIAKELAGLERMTTGELLARYSEVFGETSRSRHRQYLVRRIAWRIQANAEGGLSERAIRRAAELADPAEARVTPPRTTPRANPPAPVPSIRPSDPRLPPVGTVITRNYKGNLLAVTVRSDGFEYAGEHFKTLSAIAKAITGSHMNGYRFFGMEAAR